MSRLNPLIGWILRSPVHWLLSPGLMLLNVTGRKSGRRYAIPVGYQRLGDTVTVMVSEARTKQWFRNYLEPARLEVHLRGRLLAATAEVVKPESGEFRACAEATLQRMPRLGRVFHVDFDKRVGLTDEQTATLRQEIAIVRVLLDQPSA